MIRYALACQVGHTFESWFRNSSDFDKQSARKLIVCPVCGSEQVEKTLMTPRLGRSSKSARAADPIPAATAVEPPAPEAKAPVAVMSPQEAELRHKLKELRDHLIKSAENVGPRFPEEARKMHYGEVAHRSIYGEATPDEAKAMLEEGIEFHPLPVLPEDRN